MVADLLGAMAQLKSNVVLTNSNKINALNNTIPVAIIAANKCVLSHPNDGSGRIA